MVSKKDIRKNVLAIRKNMTKLEWETKSAIINDKVVAHSIFLNAKQILCYMDYKNEVSTKKIIQNAWNMGKKVFIPKVEGEEMYFYEITSFQDIIEGYKGIMEPNTDHKFQEEDGVVIMPGAAFDRKKNRIGYGKGFYDKFLECHPSLKTLAIAFELQIVDHVPSDKYDIIPDILVTEENNYV